MYPSNTHPLTHQPIHPPTHPPNNSNHPPKLTHWLTHLLTHPLVWIPNCFHTLIRTITSPGSDQRAMYWVYNSGATEVSGLHPPTCLPIYLLIYLVAYLLGCLLDVSSQSRGIKPAQRCWLIRLGQLTRATKTNSNIHSSTSTHTNTHREM